MIQSEARLRVELEQERQKPPQIVTEGLPEWLQIAIPVAVGVIAAAAGFAVGYAVATLK